MHEHATECYECCGIGETLDEHGVRECLCCHGTGQIQDKLDHRQVEKKIGEMRSVCSTLTVLTFITFIACVANWVILMVHLWVSK
jgi:hypothetical protein